MQATLWLKPSPLTLNSNISQKFTSHLNLLPSSPENPTPIDSKPPPEAQIQNQSSKQEKPRNDKQEQVQIELEEEENQQEEPRNDKQEQVQIEIEEEENQQEEPRNDKQKQVQTEQEEEEEQKEQEEEYGDSDEDFTFVCNVTDESSAADEIFENGKIRPIFPFFNSDLLLLLSENGASTSDLLPSPVKKVFLETNHPPPSTSLSESDNTTGVAWSRTKATQLSPELGKKSNSTGFSKIWKLGEFLHRSNSEGRDTFVFLNNSTPEKIKSGGEVRERMKGKKKVETSSLSAYMKSRAKKEDGQRRSYLPYKPEVVGFFTNVTGGGLSRNLHPY